MDLKFMQQLYEVELYMKIDTYKGFFCYRFDITLRIHYKKIYIEINTLEKKYIEIMQMRSVKICLP